MRLRLLLAILFFIISTFLWATEDQKSYKPAKVVYDLASPEPKVLENVLDRISMLQNLYDNNSFEASIVIVVHEGAIPLFTNDDKNKYSQLMLRARSLTMGEIIQFRICAASARMQGYDASDLQDFTTMVPMADAEIVMLQQQGYSYMR